MIPSLKIRNYRNLKDFNIKELGRVNLFTGKNNTGKTTLLEAIFIFANNGDTGSIRQIIDSREEFFETSDENKILEANFKSFSSIFNNRKIPLLPDDGISIGYNEIIEDKVSEQNQFVTIRSVRFIDESYSEVDKNKGVTILKMKRSIIDVDDPLSIAISRIGLEIIYNDKAVIFPLDDTGAIKAIQRENIHNVQFIRGWNIQHDIHGKLWDKITLTPKEEFVIEALRIIDPEIERIAFVKNENSRYERTAVIKYKGSSNLLPLSSMGDGINRIFTIILSLVNSEGGYLLIDEFENGLHYSIQDTLWKIIFDLSYRLNIQIFATTHSSDCIKTFESVLNSDINYQNSKLIRLDSINGKIKQVEYSAEDLRTATEQDIETR